MVLYKLVKSEIKVEDKVIDTYGIACVEDEKLIKCVDDISIDKEFVQSTVDTFNKNKLSNKTSFITRLSIDQNP